MSLIANERKASTLSQLENAITIQKNNVSRASKTILVNKNLFVQKLLRSSTQTFILSFLKQKQKRSRHNLHNHSNMSNKKHHIIAINVFVNRCHRLHRTFSLYFHFCSKH